MRKFFTVLVGLVLLSAGLATAQDDGSEIILPLEAQTCDLPAAPARIPEQATYDDLVAAKGNISQFQEELMGYRECLDDSKTGQELTEGNEIALNQAFNYSVEMEERVAEQFNVAVRSYKARQAD